jgi:hypothetical protein
MIMDQFTLIALLIVLLVVGLIVLRGGVRSWLIRFPGIESRIQGHTTVTRIRAADDSKVRDVVNKEGMLNIEAQRNSQVEEVRNEKL